MSNFFILPGYLGALGTVLLALNNFGKSFGRILYLQARVSPKSEYNLLDLLFMLESKHIFELNLAFWVICSMRRILYGFRIIKEPYLKLYLVCLSRNFSSSFLCNRFPRSSMERIIIDGFANTILMFYKKSCRKEYWTIEVSKWKAWWKLCFIISESQSTVE